MLCQLLFSDAIELAPVCQPFQFLEGDIIISKVFGADEDYLKMFVNDGTCTEEDADLIRSVVDMDSHTNLYVLQYKGAYDPVANIITLKDLLKDELKFSEEDVKVIVNTAYGNNMANFLSPFSNDDSSDIIAWLCDPESLLTNDEQYQQLGETQQNDMRRQVFAVTDNHANVSKYMQTLVNTIQGRYNKNHMVNPEEIAKQITNSVYIGKDGKLQRLSFKDIEDLFETIKTFIRV